MLSVNVIFIIATKSIIVFYLDRILAENVPYSSNTMWRFYSTCVLLFFSLILESTASYIDLADKIPIDCNL